MNILLTGGFTGGHIIPLIRLAKKIPNHEYQYVGFKDSLEEKLARDNLIPFLSLIKYDGTLKRYFCLKKYYQILDKTFLKKKPDLVISTGGYHSYPLISYAKKRKIKYILIEENTKIGLLNLLFKYNAYKFLTTFPIRKYELAPNPAIYYNVRKKDIKYDFLCLGGSLGSKVIINLAIKLAKKNKVLLIAGRYKNDYLKYASDNLEILGFVDSINYYHVAKIVITRSGSATLFELIKAKSHFITIPSLNTKRNHQYHNAKFIAQKKLGLMLNEKHISKRMLETLLTYDFREIEENQESYLAKFSSNFYEEILDGLK